MFQTIRVVIPTYNEAENLPLIVSEVLGLAIPGLGILVVDDNSPDGTGQIAERLKAEYAGRVDVLHNPEKGGLGVAYRAGFHQVIDAGAQVVIQMDADFSHQPHYLPELIAKLEAGADMCLGSRFSGDGAVDTDWGRFRKLLSWFANAVYVPTILQIPVHDATGGYRAWRADGLSKVLANDVRSNGYVFQVEMVYAAHRLGLKVVEIPIYFPDRQKGVSKMRGRIVFEAALRVWQIRWRYRTITK